MELAEIPIEVADSAGKLHKGVALGTHEFADVAVEYFKRVRVNLADEVGQKPHTTSFAERVAMARAALENELVSGNDLESRAFLFEDSDVRGWTGPAASLRPVSTNTIRSDVIDQRRRDEGHVAA